MDGMGGQKDPRSGQGAFSYDTKYIISQIARFSRQFCHFVQSPQVPVHATIGITIPRYYGTTNRRIWPHGVPLADPSLQRRLEVPHQTLVSRFRSLDELSCCREIGKDND